METKLEVQLDGVDGREELVELVHARADALPGRVRGCDVRITPWGARATPGKRRNQAFEVRVVIDRGEERYVVTHRATNLEAAIQRAFDRSEGWVVRDTRGRRTPPESRPPRATS